MKHFIEQSWLLIVASFAFGLLIAVAEASLDTRIKQNEKDKLNNLMKLLIIDANDFQLAIEQVQIAGATATDVYKAVGENGNGIGFAFVGVGSGYVDEIKLVIALDSKCEKFLGFKVLSSNETPRLGSLIAVDDPDSDVDFVDQFKGAPVRELELIKTDRLDVIRKIDSQIVSISRATFSSDAVVNIFNTYTEQIKEKLQQKGLISDGR
jgi:Na+-translocating ferredoxin:NAD+ oxidoreductase RnfG subunit